MFDLDYVEFHRGVCLVMWCHWKHPERDLLFNWLYISLLSFVIDLSASFGAEDLKQSKRTFVPLQVFPELAAFTILLLKVV